MAFIKTPEQGINAAHATARDAIEDLDPSWIILVGIAGALPEREYTLGDVIVASRIHDFTTGAHIEGRAPELTNQGGRVSPQLEDLIHFLPMLDGELMAWQTDDAIGVPRPSVSLEAAQFYGSKSWREATDAALRANFGETAQRRAPIVTARAIGSSGFLISVTGGIRRTSSRRRSDANPRHPCESPDDYNTPTIVRAPAARWHIMCGNSP